jgi:hypothetical protein
MTPLHRIARQRAELVRYVGRAFPGASIDTVEDAVSYAFEVVLARPHLLVEAGRRGGEPVARALLRRIAWRSARDEWRSHQRRTDALARAGGRLSGERNEVGLMDLELSVDGLVEASCRSFPRECRVQLAAAVRRRLFGGMSDAEVAAEYRVRREYVQRCRSTLVAQIAAA